MEIQTVLFIVVSILVALILLVVLGVLVYALKVIRDVREVSTVIKEVTNEIDTKGLMPFLQQSQLKKDLIQKVVEKAPSILPLFSSFIVHSILKKAQKPKRKSRKKSAK